MRTPNVYGPRLLPLRDTDVRSRPGTGAGERITSRCSLEAGGVSFPRARSRRYQAGIREHLTRRIGSASTLRVSAIQLSWHSQLTMAKHANRAASPVCFILDRLGRARSVPSRWLAGNRSVRDSDTDRRLTRAASLAATTMQIQFARSPHHGRPARRLRRLLLNHGRWPPLKLRYMSLLAFRGYAPILHRPRLLRAYACKAARKLRRDH